MNKKSGHWTNTGMAKFINDNLYNYNSEDEKSMNPFRWYRLQNGDDVSKYRETINGFPCRLILINDGSTPLNEGQNEPTPGNTKDMGIFNFNHDKDATKTLGFDSDIFPNCASYEVTANSDTSAGAFMCYNYIDSKYNPDNSQPDNILVGGTLTQKISIDLFDTKLLTISNIMRTDGSQSLINSITLYDENRQRLSDLNSIWSTDYTLDLTEYNAKYFSLSLGWGKVKEFKINGKTFICNFVEDATNTYVDKEIWQTKELAYLKESFELRHPDEDDVAEDWGFMGVEAEIPQYSVDYTYSSIFKNTTYISTDFFNSDTLTVKTINDTDWQITYVDTNGEWKANSSIAKSGESLTIDKSYPAMSIVDRAGNPTPPKLSININGFDYTYGNDLNGSNEIKNPYPNGETIKGWSDKHGLKALIDWVDNCTDEEFVRDFEEHFHKDYTLRYFCLVTLIGAVDNLG